MLLKRSAKVGIKNTRTVSSLLLLQRSNEPMGGDFLNDGLPERGQTRRVTASVRHESAPGHLRWPHTQSGRERREAYCNCQRRFCSHRPVLRAKLTSFCVWKCGKSTSLQKSQREKWTLTQKQFVYVWTDYSLCEAKCTRFISSYSIKLQKHARLRAVHSRERVSIKRNFAEK